MRKTSLITMFVLMAGAIVLWGCSDDDTQVTPPMPDVTVGTVSGYVKDTAGNALAGVSIQTANLTTPTDLEGYFSLANVPTGEQVVAISHAGHAPNHRRAIILEDATTYLPDITLMAVESYEIEATAGGTVTTADSRCSVTFPPSSFVTATGAAYSGTVTVQIQAALPGDAYFDGVFPGRYEGVLTDGSTDLVRSFGFADISISDNSMAPLQLAHGTTAALRLDTDPAQTASAPASIPLWYLDPADGRWHEEGTATLEGESYTGAVAHFSAWNVDQLLPGASVCRVEGILRGTDGNPLQGGVIKGRVPGGGIGDEVVSGSDGQFSLRGAVDEPFLIWATFGETVSEPVNVVLTGDCPFSLDITFNEFVPTSTVELDWDSAAIDLYAHFYVPMSWDDGQDPDYDL
nr:carboxypeptidase-like regulatory domain-containing protein [Candidatus Krumholzibacteria bacterium]